MLKRVDRVQIAVGDRAVAERAVADVFGGELVGRDLVAPLRAKRSTMQAGITLIELLEPDGAGPVRDFVAKWQSGLFAAGFSVDDTDDAARHFTKRGVRLGQSGGQLFLDPAATLGMRTVISQHHERAPVGAIKWAYEVTYLVSDWSAASDHFTATFALDASKFCPVESKPFGYKGTLTLFDPPARLDRIEIAQPTNYDLAMGRYHRRRGDSLYMFFVETDDVVEVARRLKEYNSRFAAMPHDEAGLVELFIHPSALFGVLVGVSRTERAWAWSGEPERARRAASELASRRDLQ